jgi:hypothetical protein
VPSIVVSRYITRQHVAVAAVLEQLLLLSSRAVAHSFACISSPTMKHFVLASLLAATVSARRHQDMNNWRTMGHLPGKDWEPVRGVGNATFKQIIDHNNPGLGTFEQFYYYDTTYWKGPGM